MYYEGHGVPQNYDEAIKWYRLAANQGDILAKGLLESTLESLPLLKRYQSGGRAEILRESARKRSSRKGGSIRSTGSGSWTIWDYGTNSFSSMREGVDGGYSIYNYGGGPNVSLSPDGSGGFHYYEW